MSPKISTIYDFHKIMESFRLERPAEIVELNHSPQHCKAHH